VIFNCHLVTSRCPISLGTVLKKYRLINLEGFPKQTHQISTSYVPWNWPLYYFCIRPQTNNSQFIAGITLSTLCFHVPGTRNLNIEFSRTHSSCYYLKHVAPHMFNLCFAKIQVASLKNTNFFCEYRCLQNISYCNTNIGYYKKNIKFSSHKTS
jgi:hypothetical protein